MEPPQKSDFGIMCRELRVNKRLKQREVAEGIGVKLSTVGNIESSPWKVVGIDKVNRMVEFFQLPPDRAAELRSAWERVPLSEYGAKQRESWQRRNKMRSKAKHYDKVQRSLAEVLGLAIEAMNHQYQGRVCTCAFDRDELCEICMALDNLGLDTFTTLEKATSDLAALQDKLESARVAAAQNANGTT